MASGSEDKTIRIWDTQTNQLLFTIQDNCTIFSLAAINNHMLASASDDKIKFWNLTDGVLVKSLTSARETFAVTSIKLLKDGRRLAAVSSDAWLKIWDVVDYKL